MPNWNRIAHERLAVLRLPPEREIEIVEGARPAQGYDWRLLSHDFLSFGLRIKILISNLLLPSHTSYAIIPIISP